MLLESYTSHDLPGVNSEQQRKCIQSTDPRMHLMLVESCRTQLPEAYHDDLYVHDRIALEDIDGDAIWILRRCGTHLYPVDCESESAARYCREVIRHWSSEMANDNARYYLLSRNAITPITWRDAIRALRVVKST